MTPREVERCRGHALVLLGALLAPSCTSVTSFGDFRFHDGGGSDDSAPDGDAGGDSGSDADVDVDADTDIDVPDDAISVDATGDGDTTLACWEGTADCNSWPDDGCETDTTSDPASCGACWHDCLGGACVGGACQPIVLASPLGMAPDLHNGLLALGDVEVYFSYVGTPAGGVAMVPKDGTFISCIQCDVGEPRELATTRSAVYWVDPGLGELRMAPRGGESVRTIWRGAAGSPIAVDDTGVYWYDAASSSGPGAVMRADLDGGNLTVLVSGQANVSSIAVQAGIVVWTTSNEVLQQDRLVGRPTQLAMGLTSPRSVALDRTHVYWVTGPWGGETLQRVPIGGGRMEPLGVRGAYAIALDDLYVYAADNANGEIWRVPKAGGPTEVLATGQPNPFDIAVDDVAVYWTSEVTAEVSRVVK
jgi:hypothetical protein